MKNLNIIVSIFLSIATFVPSFAQEGGDLEGLYTEKTSQFEDGKGLITLDTFVTGEVTKVYSSGAPCDIVLVLDFSNSMDNKFADSGKTKIDVLKTAVSNFLDNIKENATKYGLDHRVAIVSYNTFVGQGQAGSRPRDYIDDGTIVWPQNVDKASSSGRITKFNPYGGADDNNQISLQINTDATSKAKMSRLFSYVYSGSGKDWSGPFIPILDKNHGINNTPDDVEKTTLKHIVDYFSTVDTQGSTATFRGIEEAFNVLKNKRNLTTYVDPEDGTTHPRPTFVVLFTDGVPAQDDASNENSTVFTDSNKSIAYAYNTIVYANQLKNDKELNTTVYTVGIHANCNPVPSNSSNPFVLYQNYCYTPRSYFFDVKNNTTSPSNCDNALNCFLHMVSSNYVGTDMSPIENWYLYDVSTMTYNDKLKIQTLGMGRWANGGTLDVKKKLEIINGGHYMSANNPEGLNKVFQDISSEIIEVTVPVPLGTETKIKDFIDNTTFKLPDGTEPGDIQFYTRDIKSITENGNAKFYEFYPADDRDHTKVPAGVTVNFDEVDSHGNQGVTVTGFDFADNYVGYDENMKLHGCELEVLIPFEFQDGFEHTDGTYQTNSPESGIYDDSDKPIQPYPVPSIMIRDINITRKNLETGESVVYDVYKVGKTFEYKKDDLRYRVVLTGVSDDGSEDVSCTITGATAYEEGDYVYWLVQEAGWSWAYDLINMDGDPRAKVQSFQDSQLKFVFEGPHKLSDPTKKEAPINKLFHAETHKKRTVKHPQSESTKPEIK